LELMTLLGAVEAAGLGGLTDVAAAVDARAEPEPEPVVPELELVLEP
jgi:hypothetical protein